MSYFRHIPDRSPEMRARVDTLSKSKDYRQILQAAKLAKYEIEDYYLAARIIDKYKSAVKTKFKNNPSTRKRLLTSAEKQSHQWWLGELGRMNFESSGLAQCLS